MKHFITCILILATLLTLASCGQQASPSTHPPEPSLPLLTAAPETLPPESPARPITSFDPAAPYGDTACEAYAWLMDSVAAQLRGYDGSNWENFTVTIEDPFDIAPDERHEFFDVLFLHTYREYPEFFWINLGSRPQSYDEATKLVTYTVDVLPQFRGEAFASARQALSDAVRQITSELFQPGMSDMEKVLAVYGWMQQYVKYDAAADWNAYSAYSALVNRSAVCHGCAVAFNLLLQEANIGCCTVLSYVPDQNLYHIWNAVNVNGSWYNIDPTAGYVPGYLSYRYFLRSTGEMLDGSIHCEHVTRMHVDCDTPYPHDIPWSLTSFPFLYSQTHQSLVNVENCILQNGTVYLADFAVYRTVSIDENGTVDTRTLATIPSIVFCCTPEYNGCLYYMTYDGYIRSHCVSTGEDSSVTDQNYKGFYLCLDQEAGALLIVNSQGVQQDILSLLPNQTP